MDRFYQTHYDYGKDLKVSFVTRRLARLILKESRKFDWIYTYFRLGDDVRFSPVHRAVAMGTNGILLVVKEE